MPFLQRLSQLSNDKLISTNEILTKKKTNGSDLYSERKCAWLSGLQLVPEKQSFPVRVRSLAVCRGEISAAIVQLLPVSVKQVDMVERS